MKIVEVEGRRLHLPLKEKYEEAAGTYSSMRSLFVKVFTDGGVEGIGEVHESVPGYTHETLDTMHSMVAHVYGPAVIGCDLESFEVLHRTMMLSRRGNAFARCALEMALIDALARARAVNIATLLGGPVRRQLALVGSLGINDPKLIAEKAAGLVAAGYRNIKIKIGTCDIQKDLACVREVRAAIGQGIKLQVDANAGYILSDALTVARGLANLEIEHLEQPVAAENLEGMSRLTRLGAVPILADESVQTPQDALKVISSGAADGIKIKICKVGGYVEARKIIDLAEAAGIKLVLGSGICSSIEAAAEVQLGCAYPHVWPVAEMGGPAKLTEDLVRTSLDMRGGNVDLPPGIGLGVEVSESQLRKYTLSEC